MVHFYDLYLNDKTVLLIGQEVKSMLMSMGKLIYFVKSVHVYLHFCAASLNLKQ